MLTWQKICYELDQTPLLGVFGKVPTRREFFKLNLVSPELISAAEWLHKSIEYNTQAYKNFSLFKETSSTKDADWGAKNPRSLWFFYRDLNYPQYVFLSIIKPSEDALGRKYPLTFWLRLKASFAAKYLAVLPLFFLKMVDFTESIGRDLQSKNDREIIARLQAYPRLLTFKDLKKALYLKEQYLQTESLRLLHEELFRDFSNQELSYVYYTFMAACKRSRLQPYNQSGISLDCPVNSLVHLTFWLEFVEQALGWKKTIPSFMWALDEDLKPLRLLLNLGMPSLSFLTFFCSKQTQDRDFSLWPLVAKHPEVLKKAAGSFTAKQQEVLFTSRASLAEILKVLMHKK